MKKVLSFCLLMMVCVWTQAQVTVSGKIVSKKDGSIIEMATVRLMHDSVLVQGAQTDADGEFYLLRVPAGRYQLLLSSVGFREYSRTVEVRDQEVNIPTVRLEEDVQALAEVDIKGHAAEMTVKGDTMEYNTAAYKMGENDMVEDMLKKMNGVQVDKEGNVTVNGESIKGIRIDGKKFFGNDVQAATKNIPAEMIEKIQVIDEKSDMAKITGIEDDDTERIINLTLKPNRKKGVFGNYSLGVGADMVADNGRWFGYDKDFMKNDFRYNGNVMTNVMLGESQTTIIAGAGNTNEIRSGRGRGGWGDQSNEGITRAENIGVNTNIDLSKQLKNPKAGASLLLGGDASMNHSVNDVRSETDKTIYSRDLTYHNMDSTIKLGKTWDAQMRLEVEYKADSANRLLLKPNISYTNTESSSDNNYDYWKGEEQIKLGGQHQFSLTEKINASLQAIYSHNFRKPGRVLSMDAQVGVKDSKGNSRTVAENRLTGIDDVNQRVRSKSDDVNYSLKVSWMEPIYGRNHFLETALTFKGSHRASEKYQEKNVDGNYVYDPDYSNNMRNDYYQEILSVNYRLVQPSYDLTVGAQVNPSQTLSKTYYGGVLQRDTTISVWNWSPNASLKYKFGKKEFMRLRYRGRSSQPSVNQMEPVRNNSNAMYESVGNLGLNPSFQHSVYWMYSRYNEKRQSSVMTGIRANLTKDALVSNTIYDQTGKQYSQTVNADRLPWDLSANVMYNTPFANKLMQFHTRTTIGYNERIAYVLREQETAVIDSLISHNTLMRGEQSKTGNLTAGEELTLRLTHDIVDVGVRANVNYTRTQNTLRNTLNNTINYGVTGDVQLHLPKSWNISTDIGYTGRWGYQLNDVDEIIWNASVDKTWKNATLSLKAYDLLHQKKNIVQVVSADAVSYKKFNTLPTYFLLTFTYKLNKMGDLKAKGAAGFMQEMNENGGRPNGGMPPYRPM